MLYIMCVCLQQVQLKVSRELVMDVIGCLVPICTNERSPLDIATGTVGCKVIARTYACADSALTVVDVLHEQVGLLLSAIVGVCHTAWMRHALSMMLIDMCEYEQRLIAKHHAHSAAQWAQPTAQQQQHGTFAYVVFILCYYIILYCVCDYRTIVFIHAS